jgi:arylsulfatase A-like enzyme
VVGDHGARVYGAADIPLTSYEIPILFLAPGRLAPGRIDTAATQLDIAPTVLGMLGEPYQAPFYGQNLLALDPGADRALLFNHNHDVGALRGEQMVVLGLHGQVTGFRWDAESKTLVNEAADPGLTELATAYFQVAYEQFRDGFYR